MCGCFDRAAIGRWRDHDEQRGGGGGFGAGERIVKRRMDRGVCRGDPGDPDELVLERGIGSEIRAGCTLSRRRDLRRARTREDCRGDHPPHAHDDSSSVYGVVMRCALLVVVLLGTSCHPDEAPSKDRCTAAYDRLIRIGATKFKETPTELIDECHDGRIPKGAILACGLDATTDQQARQCIDQLTGSGSAP